MSKTGSRPARIGYVLKVFPRVSETFVVNEIRALEGCGESIRIFSLHHGDPNVPHAILESLRSPVVYVDDELPCEDAVAPARRQLERLMAIPPHLQAQILPRKYVRLAMRLAEFVAKQGITHLHAHFASRAGHVAALAGGLSGVPFSMTAHAKDIYHQDVDRDVLRWKIGRARFVVTVTDYNLAYLRELMSAWPEGAAKIQRLYNGVDLQRFDTNHAAPIEGTLFLGIGRLVEKKGFALLVRACELLRDRGHSPRCEIIGGGPEESALRRQIEAAGLREHVTLRGVCSTEEVAVALERATAVVLPCIVARDGNVDALPTVLLEAAAAGRPAISTRLSGIPEIIVDGETGWLVPAGDSSVLADALARVLDDPLRTREMGLAARRRATEMFDLQRNAEVLRGWLHGEPLPGAK